MYKIPTILYHDELLDKAFHKAAKIPENVRIKNRVARKKKHVVAQIDSIADSLYSIIGKYISTFPSFDRLHKFEFELINTIIGIDKLRKSLGALDWARHQINNIKVQLSKKISQVRGQKDYSKLEQYRKTFYGRVSSVLKQVSDQLTFLNTAREKLKKLPQIDPEATTIVVAGFPNVGKSLLVKQISSAKPKIATYPFTTQQLNLGHINMKNQKIQIIDTPGLLDRSPEKRNKIEKQAIMALQYLADFIIFITDPSEHCGYSLEAQDNLLLEIQRLFENVQIINIENKVDLFCSNTNRLKISAKQGDGLDELLEVIQALI